MEREFCICKLSGDTGFHGSGHLQVHKPRAPLGLLSKNDVHTTGSRQQMSQTFRATLKYAGPRPPAENLSIMPGFQHYISGVPEPFCRCQIPSLPKNTRGKFRSVRAVNGKNLPFPFVR